MVDTTNKGFERPAFNSYVDSWDVPVNQNWTEIDEAFGKATTLNAAGLGGTSVTLTVTQYRPLTLRVTGAPGGIVTYEIPSGVGGQWVVRNETTGGYAVQIVSLAGGSTISIPASSNAVVSCDGTSAGMVYSDNRAPTAAGSNTQVQYNSSGTLAGSANLTFNGTTLVTTGLSVVGNTLIGLNAGSTLTIYGTALTVPNNLNIAANTLYVNSGTGAVGIGTSDSLVMGAYKLTVMGSIKITTGSLVFPDGTFQTTAATGSGGGLSSVGLSGGSTGLTVENSPLISNGTMVLGGTLAVTAGGTGLNVAPSAGALLIGTGLAFTLGTLTAGSGISIVNAAGSITISSSTVGVTSVSFGSTGLTPATPQTGAVVVGGTLAVTNGGTGVTSSTGSGSNVLSVSPTFTGTAAFAAISTSGNITVGGTVGQTTNFLQVTGSARIWNAGPTASIYCDNNLQYFFNPGGVNGVLKLTSTQFECAATPLANQTSWSLISDRVTKREIDYLDPSWDRIMRLKPASFTQEKTIGRRPIVDRGFIAQDFEDVYPDSVTEFDVDGRKLKAIGLDMAFYADMVSTMQALVAEVDRLKRLVSDVPSVARA